MEHIYFFLVYFILIFLVMLGMHIYNKKKGILEENKGFILFNKYKLNRKKIDFNKLGILMALVNSFIIAFTGSLISVLEIDLIWVFMIGFIILMILIYTLYNLIGIYLKRRENKK